MISRTQTIKEARGLLEPGEERDNPEYLRALCELIARCFPDGDAKIVEYELTERVPRFYVWVEGCCDNNTGDFQQAVRWAQAWGRDDVYITDLDNNVVWRAEP